LVKRGDFRSDLFYRLSVLVITLPPLRERGREDIELLVHHFLRKEKDKQARITDEALNVLASYEWPGNVRELENTIEHALAVCSDNLITAEDLPTRITNNATQSQFPATLPPVSLFDDRPTLDELNKRYIQLVLAEAGGNKSRAAEILGINRRTLYRYLDPTNETQNEELD
jgi:two-component system NtrC family response regulator